jgi:hypothetical protein
MVLVPVRDGESTSYSINGLQALAIDRRRAFVRNSHRGRLAVAGVHRKNSTIGLGAVRRGVEALG